MSTDLKRDMVLALNNQSIKNYKRRAIIEKSDIARITLASFINNNTMTFFKILDLNIEFLKKDPEYWTEDINYINNIKKVKSLTVVNDVAERGVAMAQSYSGSLTKSEIEFQKIIQVVESHRNTFQNCNKKTITQNKLQI